MFYLYKIISNYAQKSQKNSMFKIPPGGILDRVGGYFNTTKFNVWIYKMLSDILFSQKKLNLKTIEFAPKSTIKSKIKK